MRFVYDAFGRLRKVYNGPVGESALVAEYRYNGLGFRTMAQYDEDADGVFEANERVYFAYDERWRMIASFRNQDANPKEAFVYHAAGKAGRGGASYIDSVILRDRNTTGGWTGSAGTTLDERRFYLQNWRADVIAVIKDDGDPVEYVRYSSYGEPFVYPVADVNRDGVVSATDSDDFYDLFTEGNSSWNRSAVSFDLNRNGSFFDDDTLFNESYSANSGKSGSGRLSHDSVLNRKGYAGYEWDPVVGVFHVRNRVYLPQIGRWSKRDPIEEDKPSSQYAYVSSSPTLHVDSLGLFKIKFDDGFTQSEKDRINDSMSRLKNRTSILLQQLEDLLAKESECVKDDLKRQTKLLRDLLQQTSDNLNSDTLDILFKQTDITKNSSNMIRKYFTSTPDGSPAAYTNTGWYGFGYTPSARVEGAGQCNAPVQYNHTTLDTDKSNGGAKGWFGRSDSDLDELLFHEILHTAEVSRHIEDKDASPDWDNPHQVDKLAHDDLDKESGHFMNQIKMARIRCSKKKATQ